MKFKLIILCASLIISIISLTFSLFEYYYNHRRKCKIFFKRQGVEINNEKVGYLARIINCGNQVVQINSLMLLNFKKRKKCVIENFDLQEEFPDPLPKTLCNGDELVIPVTLENINEILKDNKDNEKKSFKVIFFDTFGKRYKKKITLKD